MLLSYKRMLRPLLFSVPPERSHHFGEFLLRRKLMWRLLEPYFGIKFPSLATNIAGIAISSPVGVAAGCDKDCRFIASLLSLGFGYVVGGTVTLAPQPGNPSPRILRKLDVQGIINSLGFPSHGSEIVAERLKETQSQPTIISVSGISPEQIIANLIVLEPHVDASEVNISSPNTAGLTTFHKPATLKDLLDRLNAVRTKPLFVKIPPYSNERTKVEVLNLVSIIRDVEASGVTVTNTLPTVAPELAVGRGGLSGKPVFNTMLQMVKDIRREAGERLVINACGGVFTAKDAISALEAGADSVQIYTGLIYEGPGIARRINQGLADHLSDKGLNSVRDLKPIKNDSSG